MMLRFGNELYQRHSLLASEARNKGLAACCA